MVKQKFGKASKRLKKLRKRLQFEIGEFDGGIHFFCFRPETPFFGKFDSKSQNYQFNLVPRLIRICRVQCRCSLCFRSETPFLGTFGPKNQNCQLKLKFGTKTNLNMQNSMVVFTFSVLYKKDRFW